MPTLPFPRALLAVGLVLAVGLAGCDHTTDPDGPRLIDLFGPFSYLQELDTTQDAVDFAAGETVAFTAQFSKQVDWVVEITGQQSGAVKRIEGFSDQLSIDNATWNGGTTELPFFIAEPVDVALFVPEEANADTLRTSLQVVSPRVYPGNVFADFEEPENVFVGNFEFEFQGTGVSSEVPAGEGEQFYLLRGTEPPSGSTRNFFVGLIDIRPEGAGLFPVPTTVPEDLYFNFMVRGLGTNFTIAVVQLVVDGNGSGAYEIDQDITVPFGDIRVDFEGWRLFSKAASTLGDGITQEQAANIVGVRVVLISADNEQPTPPEQVAFGIDYITFTGGGPLEL